MIDIAITDYAVEMYRQSGIDPLAGTRRWDEVLNIVRSGIYNHPLSRLVDAYIFSEFELTVQPRDNDNNCFGLCTLLMRKNLLFGSTPGYLIITMHE